MDPAGEAAGGSGVIHILHDVIRKLHDLKEKDEILLEFTGRLRRLQAPVSVLYRSAEYGRDSSEHPAHQWLQRLREQLQKLDSLLVQHSGGKVEWSGTSEELAEVDKKISKSLQEEPLVYDAERSWRLSEALTSGRPDLIRRTYSQFQDRTGRNDGGSPSSPDTPGTSLRRGISISPNDFAEPEVRYGAASLAQKLIPDLIKANKRSKWFGLTAIGGSGKTFIAKEVFLDKRIAEHFTGGKLWLTVSKQTEHHAALLLRDLWLRMHHGHGGDKFPEGVENAKAKVKELLNKKKALLVLDDVYDRKMLGYLDVISEGTGSVILVTTRDEGIFKSDGNSRSVADAAQVHQVPPLSEKDSLSLFSWHAFGQRRFSPSEELETVARAIVSECKGHPLTLKVIGAAMGGTSLSRTEKMRGKRLREKWEAQLARLRKANSAGDSYDALYGRLQLSVDDLAEEDVHLRDCFFYFAAYPEDDEVFVEDLAGLWVAEGLVENNDLLPGETRARAFLALLVEKSLIELVHGVACKVHDVMRDLAVRNLKGLTGSGQKRDVCQWECLYEPSWKSAEFPTQWTGSKTPLDVKRLSLVWSDIQRLPDNFSARHLQVLLLSGNRNLKALPLGFFSSLSLLRVLDLSGTGVVKLSGDVVRNLKSLVRLDLMHCINLRKISKQLETLQNLETIRTQHCHETFCFPVLKHLPKLTTLKTDVCQNAGSGGLLTNSSGLLRTGSGLLKKTSSGLVRSSSGVKSSSGLARSSSGLTGPARRVPPIDFLMPHKNLKEVSVRDGTREVTRSLSVSSLSALETLWLNSLPLPEGILELHRLRELYIRGHRGPLPALDSLPGLQDLTIDRLMPVEEGNRLPESFGRKGAFPALLRLQLIEMDLENFVFHAGALPVIERLNLATAKNVPLSLSELHNLTSLRILSRHNIGNLSDMFSDPASFPNLRTLELVAKQLTPPQVKSLPALSRLVWSIPKREWPANVAELEQSGKLEVHVVRGF